jgi:hypothetical protein
LKTLRFIILAAFMLPLLAPHARAEKITHPVGPELMGYGRIGTNGICGSSYFSDPDIVQEYLENTRRLHPEIYERMQQLSKAPATGSAAFDIGDNADFHSFNLKDKTFFLFSAKLMRSGERSFIWVAQDALNGNQVTDTEVDEIFDVLENQTPADPNRGIIEFETEFFGDAPNIDGDGKVDVILVDIQDGALAGGAFIAGYFTRIDQQRSHESSNQKDILYVDTFPGIYNGARRTTEHAVQTVAHEYQHLVHHTYDDSEENWVNEGLSTYAEVLTGFEPSNYSDYMGDTDRPLSEMITETDGIINEDVLKDYHKVQLWTLYLAEQFGISFIRDLTQSPRKGKAGVEDAARKSQAGITFDSIFQGWVMANFLNDRSLDSAWGYERTGLAGLPPLPHVDYFDYPIVVTGSEIGELSYEFIKFSSADSLRLTLTASSGDVKFMAIERGADLLQVQELTAGEEYRQDEFGVGISNVVIAVINFGTTPATYDIDANAIRTLLVEEFFYDDGTPDVFSGNASFLGFGDNLPGWGWAVRYTPPASTAQIVGASFYMFTSADTRFNLHVWDAEGPGGSPGSDLMEPLIVEPGAVEGWVEVDLSAQQSQLTNFTGDFYIGAIHTIGAGIYLGVDNSHPQEEQTLGMFGVGSATPGWYQLRDLQVSDIGQDDTTYQTLAGFNMMMRVRTSVDVRAVPPTIPGGMTAAAQDDHVLLDWRASSEVDVTAYDLYRGADPDFTPDSTSLIATLEHPFAEYMDHNVAPGVVYFYKLKARDIDGFDSEPTIGANAQVALPGERAHDADTRLLWHFNENQGALIYDESTGNIDGTLNAVQWTAGRYGAAPEFDGRFSAIEADPVTVGKSDESFTVELWYKMAEGFETQDRTLITHGLRRYTQGKWAIYYDADLQQVIAYVEANASGGGLSRTLSSSYGTDSRKWYHVALVRDHANDAVELYIDGELQDAAEFPGALSLQAETLHFKTIIGRDARVLDYVPRSNFLGLIDDVRISSIVRTFEDIDIVSGLEEITGAQLLPKEFALHANYPNPFNPSTTIAFDIPQRADVTIAVYDILGRKVKTLVSEMREAGAHTVVWDGTNRQGVRTASGVYLMRMETAAYTTVRKMVLLK